MESILKTMVLNLKQVMDEGPENFKNYDISEHVDWVVSVQTGSAPAPAAAAAAAFPPSREIRSQPRPVRDADQAAFGQAFDQRFL